MSKRPRTVAPALVKPEEDRPKELLPIEFERMEKERLTRELRDKERDYVRLKIAGLQDKKKILELMGRCYATDEKLAHDDLAAIEAKCAAEKTKHEAFVSTIRERLGLEGRFGYNPDTLEVIQG